MKPPIIIQRTLLSLVLFFAALALSSSVHSLHAQQPPGGKTMQGQPMMKQDGDMMAERNKLMAEHTKMMADMKAQDAELAGMVAKLKGASQSAKVDLLADIVTRMVEQRTAMHANLDKMHRTMPSRPMKMMHSMCPCCPMQDGTSAKSPETPTEKN